jgi:hypothetical protein
MCALANRDRRGLPLLGEDRRGQHACVVITRVSTLPAIAWPSGWEDVEVVNSVLVDEPPALPAGAPAGAYDRTGRVPDAACYGRLVSVVA